ncbi:MAG: YraN family protein [Chthoniobacter sp.]|uniref:YraN family protein n=1 Tax=Chthoniobacter sp. TaxID=2510640 RepID=UPI0032A55F15
MGLVRFIADLFSLSGRRSFRSPDEGEDPDQWLGREGERLAARYLRRHGYKVLYRNFRAPHGGEVDVVCRDKTCDTLVFVEVKTRRSLAFGTPGEAVTREKQKLIARGALAGLELLGNPEIIFRFDIVEILFEEDTPSFHIIKDAFKLPEPYIY